MDDLVGRLLRELPDTDKDRYDIAFARGRAQSRSSLLFGGLALGLATGAAATLLLDPSQGRGRRAAIRQRLGEVLHDLRVAIEARRADVRNRAFGAETELGLPETPPISVHERAHEAPAVASRPDVRTPPRSSVAAGLSQAPSDGRDPVAAGLER